MFLSTFKKNFTVFLGISVGLITFACFIPSLSHDFLSWEDTYYIHQNPLVTAFSQLPLNRICFDTHGGLWIPLTWISLAFDFSEWGFNPFGFHLTNLILHSLNAMLLYFLLEKLVKTEQHKDFGEPFERSIRAFRVALQVSVAVATLTWAIHPLRVESVSWISGRKDLLSVFFILVAAHCVYSFLKTKSFKVYTYALLAFWASLLSKPSALLLPLLLCLFLNKKERIKYTLPFLGLSLVSIFATLKSTPSTPLESYPLLLRCLNAVTGWWFYLIKTVFPLQLSPLYPLETSPSLHILAIIASIFGLIGLGFWLRKTNKIPISLVFYTLALLPSLGLVHAGDQAMANRFSYLPLLVTSYWAFLLISQFSKNKLLTLLLGIIIPLLFYLNIQQQGIWKSTLELWTYAVQQYPNHAAPHSHLAKTYLQLKNTQVANKELSIALKLTLNEIKNKPNSKNFYELGGLYLMLKQPQNAILAFENSLKRNPKQAEAHFYLGQAYTTIQNPSQAIFHYQQCLELNPQLGQTWLYLGLSYYKENQFKNALMAFQKAAIFSPHSGILYFNLGLTYMHLNNVEAAKQSFQKAESLGYNPPEQQRLLFILQGTPYGFNFSYRQ